jgi:hypothetical protein
MPKRTRLDNVSGINGSLLPDRAPRVALRSKPTAGFGRGVTGQHPVPVSAIHAAMVEQSLGETNLGCADFGISAFGRTKPNQSNRINDLVLSYLLLRA